MAYTPTNMRMFLAAFSGALAGMNVSDRVPKNSSIAFYASAAVLAGAWAISFDGEWDDSTDPNVLQVQTAQEASESVWQQRAPIATTANVDPDSWDALTAPIVALIRAADAYMTAQGITPPDAGGGSGGPGNWPVPRIIFNQVYDVVDEDMVLINVSNLGDSVINFPLDSEEGRVLVVMAADPAVSQGNSLTLIAPTGGTIEGTSQVDFYCGTNTFQCLGNNTWVALQGLRVTCAEFATPYPADSVNAGRIIIEGQGAQLTSQATSSGLDATIRIPGTTSTVVVISDTDSPYAASLAGSGDIRTRSLTLLVDSSGGPVTINITDFSQFSRLTVVDNTGSSSTNPITIDGGVATISGSPTFVVNLDWRTVTIESFDANFSVVAVW